MSESDEFLEKVKSLRKNFNLEIFEERFKFLCNLEPLILSGQLVRSLHDILQPREMDDLIETSVRDGMTNGSIGRTFIDFLVRIGYKDRPRVDAECEPISRRATPVHRATTYQGARGKPEIFRYLFEIYDRYDVNYSDEDGLTHFHVACMFGCDEAVEKFLELGRVDPDCPVPKTGDTPLHLAATGHCISAEKIYRALLFHGADPNSTNEQGSTPLQILCSSFDRNKFRCELAKIFLEVSEENGRAVMVGARGDSGIVPLFHAIEAGSEMLTEMLLRRGADPNAANDRGATPLHAICEKWSADKSFEFLELFFEMNDEGNREVLVDARDKSGRTPLHRALDRGHVRTVESLLSRGADPNLPDNDGRTALHVICQKDGEIVRRASNLHNEMAKIFFKTSDERNLTLRLDARDKLGRTPLQLAVASLKPSIVDALLSRGAEPASFVSPSESQFRTIDPWNMRDRLKKVTDAWAIVDSLEKAGYELDRGDALTLMKMFHKYGSFKKARELDELSRRDPDFVCVVKSLMTNQDGLILFNARLTNGTDQCLFHRNLYDFVHSEVFASIPHERRKISYAWLGEELLRKFFRSWALDCFWELIGYRLPFECCETIVDESFATEDLYHICLATAGQS